MKLTRDSIKNMFTDLKERFGYASPMQAPKIEKVIVTSGIGKVQGDKKRVALIADRLTKITGQKPKENAAKISVAGFKLREGNIIGYQVTLRGEMMYNFMDKLINIALPRTRDFRGLSVDSIDQMGNYSIGIKENTIFPETSDEDINDVFGLGITIVTTAKTKEEAEALLRGIGMPLKKLDDQSK
jgi:large subunit ribosomal protein L5